ncbi:hypothetical protein NKDENANG_02895 [Candidatus Entotheonellaceae bacterium PAL068K]
MKCSILVPNNRQYGHDSASLTYSQASRTWGSGSIKRQPTGSVLSHLPQQKRPLLHDYAKRHGGPGRVRHRMPDRSTFSLEKARIRVDRAADRTLFARREGATHKTRMRTGLFGHMRQDTNEVAVSRVADLAAPKTLKSVHQGGCLVPHAGMRRYPSFCRRDCVSPVSNKPNLLCMS